MSAALADAVLAIVAPARAHQRTGNRDGEQSLSHVRAELELRGWRRLGTDEDFRDALVAAGFSIRTHQAGRAFRNYVTV